MQCLMAAMISGSALAGAVRLQTHVRKMISSVLLTEESKTYVEITEFQWHTFMYGTVFCSSEPIVGRENK